MVNTLPKVTDETSDHTDGAYYSTAYNTTGDHKHEIVVRVPGRPDPDKRWMPGEWKLVLRGLSRAKVEAIVLLLNAPED